MAILGSELGSRSLTTQRQETLEYVEEAGEEGRLVRFAAI